MAETAYLQENVGEALKMALAAMVVDQPDDAVEFIGTYLVNHATKHEREEAVQMFKGVLGYVRREIASSNQCGSSQLKEPPLDDVA